MQKHHIIYYLTYLFKFIIVLLPTLVLAQGELKEDSKVFFRNERTFGLQLNSTGLQVDYRYAKRIDGFRKQLYEVGISNLKHPKEYKESNPLSTNQQRFVYGKVNSVFVLKPGWGNQKEIFRKQDKGGLAIRYYYVIGPEIVFLKPIYYDISFDDRQMPVTQKFDYEKNISRYNIIGKASFFKGFSEMKFVPGAFVKLGFNFEYSQDDLNIRAIEGGVLVDAFSDKIEIMATQTGSYMFFSVFVGMRIGKVINDRVIN